MSEQANILISAALAEMNEPGKIKVQYKKKLESLQKNLAYLGVLINGEFRTVKQLKKGLKTCIIIIGIFTNF